MGPPFARATVAQKLPDEELLVDPLILSYAWTTKALETKHLQSGKSSKQVR
jgi:hypothetical protein